MIFLSSAAPALPIGWRSVHSLPPNRPWLSSKNFGYPPPPHTSKKKKIKSLSHPYHTLLPAKLKDNQTPMLAPSRNTTEQRYQTNPLGLESNPGSPFSLWKHPLTRQQESKSSLWTNNKRLPADEESWGGQLLCSPLTLTAREAGRRVFSMDYMDFSSGATAAKDAAKGTKQQAVQAFVSSEERFPPPGKLRTRQSLSKLLFLKSNTRPRRVEASDPSKPLLTCFPLSQVGTLSSTSQPSSLAKLGTCQSLSKLLFLKANTRPRRVEASKPAKHPLLSPEVFPPFSSHDVAIRK